MDWVLLKNSSLVFAVGLGPKIIFLSLSLGTDKTPPHCYMLVGHPAFYIFFYILPREPQGHIRSNKLVSSSLSYELVSNFIYT